MDYLRAEGETKLLLISLRMATLSDQAGVQFVRCGAAFVSSCLGGQT